MKIDLNETPREHTMDLDHKRLEAGLFGKIFGTGPNASNNIAGIISTGILISMFTAWVFDREGSGKFMEITSPILTLALGYVFGKHSQ